jgi:hypothetical protein
MPFARGDVRDHTVSRKNDQGASYGRYAVLQWWSRLKNSFCEIFGVVQVSTFATLSAPSGHRQCRPPMSAIGGAADIPQTEPTCPPLTCPISDIQPPIGPISQCAKRRPTSRVVGIGVVSLQGRAASTMP